VLGAGPAGSTAALFLSKNGYRCHVIDKAVFPRDKVCGDALTSKVVEVLHALDPGLLQDLTLSESTYPSEGVKIYSPTGRSVRIPFSPDRVNGASHAGFTARRFNFDDFLIDQLRRSDGIALKQGISITNMRKVRDGWVLSNRSGDFKIFTRLAVVSVGAHVHALRGFTGQSYAQGLGWRAYFRNVSGTDKFLELHFLSDLLPGYLWIFPVGERLTNVGIFLPCSHRRGKTVGFNILMDNLLKTNPLLKDRFSNAEVVGKPGGFPLPSQSGSAKLSGDGWMVTGDAAGLIDPFTGEGIGNAMISGKLAAEQAVRRLQQKDCSPEFMSGYDKVLYDYFSDEFRKSRILSRAFRYPLVAESIMHITKNSGWLRRFLGAAFSEVKSLG